MNIQVQHINSHDIHNHATAIVLYGDYDLVIWEATPGYRPLRIDGYSDWKRFANIAGFYTYTCQSD